MKFKKFLKKDGLTNKEKLLATIGESSSQRTIDNKKSFLGRIRLVKTLFLAQYLDYSQEDKRLDLDLDFSDYEFFIYSHGPFSTEIMDDLDDLKDSEEIVETESSSGNRIRLTQKGEDHLEDIKEDLEDEELDRIRKISTIVSGKNGKALEELALDLLNITRDEKQDWIGFNVEKVIKGETEHMNDSDTTQESLPMS